MIMSSSSHPHVTLCNIFFLSFVEHKGEVSIFRLLFLKETFTIKSDGNSGRQAPTGTKKVPEKCPYDSYTPSLVSVV